MTNLQVGNGIREKRKFMYTAAIIQTAKLFFLEKCWQDLNPYISGPSVRFLELHHWEKSCTYGLRDTYKNMKRGMEIVEIGIQMLHHFYL